VNVGLSAVISGSMPWIMMLKPSYSLPGGWIRARSTAMTLPPRTWARPTAQALARDAVAVSKSSATQSLTGTVGPNSLGCDRVQ
jgi:hypothetical protein